MFSLGNFKLHLRCYFPPRVIFNFLFQLSHPCFDTWITWYHRHSRPYLFALQPPAHFIFLLHWLLCAPNNPKNICHLRPVTRLTIYKSSMETSFLSPRRPPSPAYQAFHCLLSHGFISFVTPTFSHNKPGLSPDNFTSHTPTIAQCVVPRNLYQNHLEVGDLWKLLGSSCGN